MEIKDRNDRVEYRINDAKWLDKDTLVITTNDITDEDGDTYHLEVEYHKDENKTTYTRAYKDECVDARDFVSKNSKKHFEQIIWYIVNFSLSL